MVSNVLPRPVRNACRVLLDPSQNGETALLKHLASRFDCNRFLVDVGANDGVTISNSLAFVKDGWRAILVEPSPAVYARLVKNHSHRANATCIHVACSDRDGEASLFFGTDGEEGYLATLCQADNEWFATARGQKSVTVKTETLTNILRSQGSPSQLGLLLVDCEGMDYEVLLGLDFSEFRPTLISTEEYEWEPEKHAAKYTLLIKNDYSLVQKVGCNTIWADRGAVRASR